MASPQENNNTTVVLSEKPTPHVVPPAHNVTVLNTHQVRDVSPLTKLQAVPIVSFELCDETLFSIPVQGVVQAERSTQLTHTQVPLEPFGVVGEGKALLAQLPEGNGFAQSINELRRQGEKLVTNRNIFVLEVKPSGSCGDMTSSHLNVLVWREQVEVKLQVRDAAGFVSKLCKKLHH